MIREIMRDEAFLSQKAEPATMEDLPVAQDLLDSLTVYKDGCVGMAANMIGVCKRIIAFDIEGTYMEMFNPEIVNLSDTDVVVYGHSHKYACEERNGVVRFRTAFVHQDS